MTLQEKILFGATVVVVAIVAVFGILKLTSSNGSPSFGAIGNLLAEHYIPYVSTNGGYSSALPIVTTSTLTSGAFTANGNVTVTTSNTATSTITVGCFQSYATSTATSLALRFTASTTAPTNGSGVIPVISYGTCP